MKQCHSINPCIEYRNHRLITQKLNDTKISFFSSSFRENDHTDVRYEIDILTLKNKLMRKKLNYFFILEQK